MSEVLLSLVVDTPITLTLIQEQPISVVPVPSDDSIVLTLTLEAPIPLSLTEGEPIFITPGLTSEPYFLSSEAYLFEAGDKALLDSALQEETDPIFTEWLSTTPPAYPDDLHTQGTDQGLDTGGLNAVTAAQAKAGYTHSGTAHAPSDAVSLSTVKNDADIASAISLKHAEGSDLQVSSDFEIADLTDVGGLRSTWSAKLDDISGQDLSTADNSTSAFITANDIPDETDPVVGAIDGIVKANGAGVISEAVAMSDYMLPFNIYGTPIWEQNHLYAIGDTFSALQEGGSTAYYMVHTGFTSDVTFDLTGKETANCYAYYIASAVVSIDGLLDETAHDQLDHTGLTGILALGTTSGTALAGDTVIPSIVGLLDETAHDNLDHSGLTGIPTKATSSEVNTGTDDAKFITSASLYDSYYNYNRLLALSISL